MDQASAMPTGLREIGHAFVLNLDRRQDRLESFQEKARRAGLGAVERVAAVDGRHLDPSAELERVFLASPLVKRPGVLGCALSHYQVWRRIADPAWPHRLTAIFEDDVFFFRGFSRLWNQEVSPWIPLGSCLLYLGGYPVHPELARHLAAVGDPLTPSQLSYVASRVNRCFARPRGPWFGTFSYVMSPEAARALCRIVEQEGLWQPVDVFMAGQWPLLEVFTTVPLLCGTDSCDSDTSEAAGSETPAA